MTRSVGLVRPSLARFDAPVTLSSGESLASHALAYETYGRLDSDGSNAVLVCHALNASHHVAGYHEDGTVGWWEDMVGPGKPIDTDRFFVIGINNLGSCFGSTGPASSHPDDAHPYGSRFPGMTVEDWVDAQARLIDRLGIRTLAAVVGGSLGGMQALSWATRHPHRVRHCVAIAACARLSAQNIAFNEVARRAIQSDPEFRNGDYLRHGTVPREGLAIARMVGLLTYTDGETLDERFGRRCGDGRAPDSGEPEFDVARALRKQADAFSAFYDANSYLLTTRALDRFDLTGGHGRLARASASFLIVSFTSDWRFPSARSCELAEVLRCNGREAEFHDIDAPRGHDAFLQDDPRYLAVVREYFNRITTTGGLETVSPMQAA